MLKFFGFVLLVIVIILSFKTAIALGGAWALILGLVTGVFLMTSLFKIFRK